MTAPTLAEQIAWMRGKLNWVEERDTEMAWAILATLEAQLEPAVYEGRRQHAQRVAEFDAAALPPAGQHPSTGWRSGEDQSARDTVIEAAREVVAYRYDHRDPEMYDAINGLSHALAALPPAP